MGRLLIYTVTNTGIRGRLSLPIKEKKSEIYKQKWKMVSVHNTLTLMMARVKPPGLSLLHAPFKTPSCPLAPALTAGTSIMWHLVAL